MAAAAEAGALAIAVAVTVAEAGALAVAEAGALAVSEASAAAGETGGLAFSTATLSSEAMTVIEELEEEGGKLVEAEVKAVEASEV